MGPLIAISGIDGAGKTTQTARLTSYLQARDPRTTQVKTRLTAQQGIFALAEALYGDPFDYHPQIPATLREFTLACDILAWSPTPSLRCGRRARRWSGTGRRSATRPTPGSTGPT